MTTIKPMKVHVPQADLDDLRRRERENSAVRGRRRDGGAAEGMCANTGAPRLLVHGGDGGRAFFGRQEIGMKTQQFQFNPAQNPGVLDTATWDRSAAMARSSAGTRDTDWP